MQYTYTGASPRYLRGYGGTITQGQTIDLTLRQIEDIERGGRTRIDQDANFVPTGTVGGLPVLQLTVAPTTEGVVGQFAWDDTNKFLYVKGASGWSIH